MSDVARLPDREPQQPSILNMIMRAAHDPNFDVAKFEKLLEMQERFEARDLERQAREAEHAYNVAMGNAQGKMKPVVRDADNKQTNSKYARLETIDDAIRPIYTEAGFSLTYGTSAPVVPGNIRVICDCAHTGGHVRRYELEGPPDTKGAFGKVNKTELHGMGSTLSYLRRYLKLLIFDVVMVGEDDDGSGIATGAGENIEQPETRRTTSPRETVRQPAARSMSAWLDDYERAAAALDNTIDADKLITSPQALWVKGNATGAARQRFEAITSRVMLTWFAKPASDDGPPDDGTIRGLGPGDIPRDGSDSV